MSAPDGMLPYTGSGPFTLLTSVVGIILAAVGGIATLIARRRRNG